VPARDYQSSDQQAWLRCQTLAFLRTAYFDDVLTSKPVPIRGAELVAVDNSTIVGLLDLTLDGQSARVSDAAEAKTDKIMLRVFFCTAGRKIILLLSGYDKGRDTSGRRQDRAISGARKLMTAHQEAQKRASKRRG
jgi:hypothetical protein